MNKHDFLIIYYSECFFYFHHQRLANFPGNPHVYKGNIAACDLTKQLAIDLRSFRDTSIC